MTAKEYLGQAYRLDQKISSDIAEAARLREMAASVASPCLEEHYNPNRPTEATFVRYLNRVWELEQRINTDIDKLVDLKEYIRIAIDQVKNPDEQLVLRYRYIHNWKWERIASEMHYSVRWIYKLHGKALTSFENAWRVQHELF